MRLGASGASVCSLALVWKPPSSAISRGERPSRFNSATVWGSSSFSPELPGAVARGRVKPRVPGLEEQEHCPAVSDQARTTAALECFFRFFVEEERPVRDPALPLRTPTKPEVLPEVLTLGELERPARPVRSA